MVQQKFCYFLRSLLEANIIFFQSFTKIMIIFITHRENTIINMVCYAFLYIYVFIGHIYYYVRPYTIFYAAKQYDLIRKNSCQFQSSWCIFMKLWIKLEKCISYIFCFGEEMISLLVLKIKQLLLKTRRGKGYFLMTPFRLNIFSFQSST